MTTHFTLEELLRSDAAVRLHIEEQFMPPPPVLGNLQALCENVLEPLRDKSKATIQISSGYRCARLNAAIGGAANSQHLTGLAVDTSAGGMTTEEWYQYIKSSGIVFDQLIQEFDRWVHISYNPHGINRSQCLRAIKENGKTIYKKDEI